MERADQQWLEADRARHARRSNRKGAAERLLTSYGGIYSMTRAAARLRRFVLMSSNVPADSTRPIDWVLIFGERHRR